MLIALALFLVVCVVGFCLSLSAQNKRRAAADASRRADAQSRANAERMMSVARDERTRFTDSIRSEWVFNDCTVNGSDAIFALRRDFKAIQVIPYRLIPGFIPEAPTEIPVANILSAEIRRDDVRETFHRTEIVAVGSRNKKSPIGRAIVGGVILGPAGAIVGAASGLGGKSQIITEEREVPDERIVKGPPYLVIGAVGRVLNVSFHREDHVDHWPNQIRGARASLGLPPIR